MRYCIYVTFDPGTQQALQDMREKLAAQVPGVPRVAGKMMPHLSLLVFDDPHPASVLERFAPLAAGMHRFGVTLKGIDSFTGRRNVLYVAPALSEPLQDSYLRCFKAFSGSAPVPAYTDPARWKPHITLCKGLRERAFREAGAIARREWTPRGADVAHIGLIDVQKPLDVLAAQALR